jgi:hypothetical protein
MSIYDAVMQGRGFRRNAGPLVAQGVAQSSAATAYAVGWQAGRQVKVTVPSPALPHYGAAMDRFSNWRGTVSPLGGTAEYPWSQAPKVGDAALKQEFRRSR